MNKEKPYVPLEKLRLEDIGSPVLGNVDFSEIIGQLAAKRALEIAAA